jgi:hypothetical protein
MDFYPTVLDLAGVPYPDQPKDGISLVPLLTGRPAPELNDRPLFWYNVTSGISDEGDAFQPAAAVRQGSWRLVKNFECPLELYDLSSDPGESVNLAETHPETAAGLEKKLDRWLADTGVVTPTANPFYDPGYVIPRQVNALPDGYHVSKAWKLAGPSCGWQAARMIQTSFVDGAMRLQADGVYPEIRTADVSGLPAGRYAVQVELNVPTSGRIRMAWSGEGKDKGDIEFFPQRDGQWHTLTAVFEAKAPLEELRLAAPTHLKATGHYDPATQPDWIEVRSIQLFSAPRTVAPDSPPPERCPQGGAGSLFSDDFTRPELGSGWTCDTDGVWMLQNGRLACQLYQGMPKPVLYNTQAETGGGFTLAGTVILNTPNRTGFAGVVCNYQDPDRQYVFRYNGTGTVQFLGANSKNAILSQENAFSHTPGTPFRLTVESSGPHQFVLTLQNAATGETVFSRTVTDPEQLYTGGFGGFYNSAGAVEFDDFTFSKQEM